MFFEEMMLIICHLFLITFLVSKGFAGNIDTENALYTGNSSNELNDTNDFQVTSEYEKHLEIKGVKNQSDGELIKKAGVVSRHFSPQEFAESLMGEKGKPDNMKEFSIERSENAGHDVEGNEIQKGNEEHKNAFSSGD